MTHTAYARVLRQAHAHCVLLLRLPLAEALEAVAHAEAVGPITDPTLFREKAGDMQVDKQVLQALHAAVRQLRRTVPEYEERTKLIDPRMAAGGLAALYQQED